MWGWRWGAEELGVDRGIVECGSARKLKEGDIVFVFFFKQKTAYEILA